MPDMTEVQLHICFLGILEAIHNGDVNAAYRYARMSARLALGLDKALKAES